VISIAEIIYLKKNLFMQKKFVKRIKIFLLFPDMSFARDFTLALLELNHRFISNLSHI